MPSRLKTSVSALTFGTETIKSTANATYQLKEFLVMVRGDLS